MATFQRNPSSHIKDLALFDHTNGPWLHFCEIGSSYIKDLALFDPIHGPWLHFCEILHHTLWILHFSILSADPATIFRKNLITFNMIPHFLTFPVLKNLITFNRILHFSTPSATHATIFRKNLITFDRILHFLTFPVFEKPNHF